MNAEFTINSDFFWLTQHLENATRNIEYRRFQFFADEGRLTPLEQTGAGRWSIGALRCLNDRWRKLDDAITFDLLPTKEGGTLVRCYADETAPEGIGQYLLELLVDVAGAFPESLPALHPVLQQGAILLQRPGQLLTGEEATERAALVAYLENILTGFENGAQQTQGDGGAQQGQGSGETAVNNTLPPVETMRGIMRSYSPQTAKAILDALPKAYSYYQTDGGVWGPSLIVAKENFASRETVSRYLNALKRAGLTHWQGAPLP